MSRELCGAYARDPHKSRSIVPLNCLYVALQATSWQYCLACLRAPSVAIELFNCLLNVYLPVWQYQPVGLQPWQIASYRRYYILLYSIIDLLYYKALYSYTSLIFYHFLVIVNTLLRATYSFSLSSEVRAKIIYIIHYSHPFWFKHSNMDIVILKLLLRTV
jgi:hypothetical protein